MTKMTDREMLELAAKAAGMPCPWDENEVFRAWIYEEDTAQPGHWWNPLTDDGDAFRLAVKCGIDTGKGLNNSRWAVHWAWSKAYNESCERTDGVQDEMAAARYVIVRAAAELGKAMP